MIPMGEIDETDETFNSANDLLCDLFVFAEKVQNFTVKTLL